MGDREACFECKWKCSLIHGKKTDPLPLVTTFIKILFGACEKDLNLPLKISQAITVLVAGENYSLQDTHGQRWEVKLGTKDGRLAFTDGWNEFYEDHGLREGYVLSFHYIMNSHFVVKIFDRTGFEKLMFPLADGRKRKRSEIDGNCNAVGECQNLSKHSTEKQDAAFTGTSDSGAKTHSQLMSKDKPSSLEIENGNLNENPVSAMVVSGELPAEVAADYTLSKNITSKRATVTEVDNDHHDDHPCVPPIENRDQVHLEYRNKSSTAPSKRVIEEAAGEKYPKFNDRSGQIFGGDERNDEVCRVKSEPVDSFDDDRRDASAILFQTTVRSFEILELPTSVTLWACDEKKVVNLRGPDKLLWPVLYQNKHGIKALTSGWKSFLMALKIQIGDRCAFILEDEAKAIFRVKRKKNAVRRS